MIHKIDLSHRCISPSFMARLIWQDLFNYYVENNGNLKEMDSFLCDLDGFRSILEKNNTLAFTWNKQKLYWVCDPESGYTEIKNCPEPYKHSVAIEVIGKEIILTYAKPLDCTFILDPLIV